MDMSLATKPLTVGQAKLVPVYNCVPPPLAGAST